MKNYLAILLVCILSGSLMAAKENDWSTVRDDWPHYGGNTHQNRFSSLSQISRSNIKNLGLVYEKFLGTKLGIEATPLIIDGILYYTTSWSRVYAVEAITGKSVWSYDPEVPRAWGRKTCCGVNNRGVAIHKGKVFVGSLDGRLIALDQKSGKKIWETDTLVDRDKYYSITGAPVIAKDLVVIGNGGAEFGVRGYVSAFHVDSGKLAWRFYTVPGNPAKPFEHPELEMAAKTWKGKDWWKLGGGGTVWDSLVYDAELNQVYIGVGNGSPWPRDIRSPGGGDNLFLCSVVALDVDSGRMKWYYQSTPAENWDYTAVQHMILSEIEIDHKPRKVLMQAPKNGFFYVLDRTDGSVIRANPYVKLN